MSADVKPASPLATRPPSDFWAHRTVEQRFAEQGVKPYDPAAWVGVPEITSEEMDWWLAELRRLRREGADPETAK